MKNFSEQEVIGRLKKAKVEKKPLAHRASESGMGK